MSVIVGSVSLCGSSFHLPFLPRFFLFTFGVSKVPTTSIVRDAPPVAMILTITIFWWGVPINHHLSILLAMEASQIIGKYSPVLDR